MFGAAQLSQRFLPARLGNLTQWFDINLSDITESSGNVSQMDDLSGTGTIIGGNDNYWMQGTGSAQPNHVGDAIVFNGSSDFMINNNDFMDASDWSVFVAIECNAHTAVVYGDYGFVTNRLFTMNTDTGGTFFDYTVRDAGGDLLRKQSTNISYGGKNVVGQRLDQSGKTITTETNGITETDTNASYDTTDFSDGTQLLLGAISTGTPTSFFNGSIRAVVVYNNKLTDVEADYIYDYMSRF